MKKHLLLAILLSFLLPVSTFADVYSLPVKCDGTTDTTAELQKWLASGSKYLYLPRGVGDCITTANLTLPENTFLIAEPGATIRYIRKAHFLPRSNSRIYGLTIDGGFNSGCTNCSDDPNTGGGTCIFLNRVSGVELDMITTKNCGHHGMAYVQAHDNRVGTVHTSSCGHRGVNISENSYRNYIGNFYGDSNKLADVIIGYGSHDNIIGNIISRDPRTASIWIHMDSYKNIIENATITMTDPEYLTTKPAVILLGHAHENIIGNMTISGFRRGILLRGMVTNVPRISTTNGHTENNIIRNFYFYGDGDKDSRGIEISDDGSGNKVRNNYILNGIIQNVAYGVKSMGPASADGNVFGFLDLSGASKAKWDMGVNNGNSSAWYLKGLTRDFNVFRVPTDGQVWRYSSSTGKWEPSDLDMKATMNDVPPVVSMCGTAPAVQNGSTDAYGAVTIGEKAAGCTISWAVNANCLAASSPFTCCSGHGTGTCSTYTHSPTCIVTVRQGVAVDYKTTATALTISSPLPGRTVDYVCHGLNE